MQWGMLLGIDVGGTHTDAVVIDESGIAASCKVPTEHGNLLASVESVIDCVCRQVPAAEIERLNLSTTLTTNAIVEGKTEEVGVLAVGGPGIDPTDFMLCRHFHALSGAIDHRGQLIRPMKESELAAAVAACRKDGIRAYAAVSKFSPRNPGMENRMAEVIGDAADVVTRGHALTGRLNFPRRLATAYFNSAIWRLFNDFADAVGKSLRRLGLSAARVNILKADGGTMPLSMAREMPVESILSGPAASIMGIISMCDIVHDSIILDIGGTTTDIAIFAKGAPLMEPDGIAIGSHPTLVRSLLTRSIGVGGDSALSVLAEEVRVGPHRRGPAMAAGGGHPTLIDACNSLGLASHGDVARSRAGIERFAAEHSLKPEELAQRAVDAAVGRIRDEVRAMVKEVNERPVYTIHELLEGRRIVPSKIYIMGGPAEVLKMPIFKAFSLSVSVPQSYAVANAVGAALTRTTRSVELFADTEQLRLHIPTLGVSRVIEPDYDLEAARRDAARSLLSFMRAEGVPSREENVEITQASSFNMVEGGRLVGRNIRVKCQIRPGILHRYKELLGRLC
jgi:N-methylhydantoinase A/oxoprolinase/acetone carboxylase beta subunit